MFFRKVDFNHIFFSLSFFRQGFLVYMITSFAQANISILVVFKLTHNYTKTHQQENGKTVILKTLPWTVLIFKIPFCLLTISKAVSHASQCSHWLCPKYESCTPSRAGLHTQVWAHLFTVLHVPDCKPIQALRVVAAKL